MGNTKRLFAVIVVATVAAAGAFAQNIVKGTVKDARTGEPIIGASVKYVGQKTGVITDVDGHFKLDVKSLPSTLKVNYLGYHDFNIDVYDNEEPIEISLTENRNLLESVVVLGYTQVKRQNLTGSVSTVKGNDATSIAASSFNEQIQGQAPGLIVSSSSGTPGSATFVRLRGTTSINAGNDPLYIIDGVPINSTALQTISNGGQTVNPLSDLNPNDIENIEVLKDAASGAIYGTRAANGVILVTTKGGEKGRVHVNYNFSYGWQNPWKHRDVLNATEYAVMMNEGLVNAGQAPIYADPYQYGKGTDWQDEVFNDNAGVVNHEVNVSGASDKINYYLSMGYYHQDGIVGGNYDRSNYSRLSLRSNTSYTLFDDTKDRDWLNKLQISANISYSRVKSKAIDANSQYGSPLGSALYLSPILTPTVSGAAAEAQSNLYGEQYMLYDGAGRMYTVPGSSYQEMNNPLAMLSLPGDLGWSHKFVANFSADLNIGYGVKYRISYGADLSFWGSDGYTPLYYLSGNNKATITNAHQSSNRGTVWQLENVLTWDKTFNKHTINLVAGQSAMQNTGMNLYGALQNLKDINKPFMNNTSAAQSRGEMSASGGPAYEHTLSSYFFRASYNYDERYLVEFSGRYDGSSKFPKDTRFGFFPSFSVAWNATNEAFMSGTRRWLSELKPRFSYGSIGNQTSVAEHQERCLA